MWTMHERTQEVVPMLVRSKCPRCGRKLVYRENGNYRWRVCPARRRCGWTVFTHGDDPRDKEQASPSPHS
jgi:ssDNA-binding Zn-finger/Zn-ribbon topoisomerase 1